MVQKFSISMRDRAYATLEEKLKNKGGLTRSEYIEECLLNYWEHLKQYEVKENEK